MVPLILVAVLLMGDPLYAASPALEAIAESSSKFSRDYFKSLESVEGNLVTSPLSAQLVLAMTQLGTGGNTASVMSSALHLPQDRTTSNEGFRQLTSTLHGQNSNGISLQIANRIYLQNNFPVNENFVTSVSNTFNSETQSVNFMNPTTRNTINQWVEQVTQNKIKDLIGENVLNADTRIVLVNAVYFYGKWENIFYPSSTYKRHFYISESNSVEVPFMSQKSLYRFANLPNLNSKIVVLPYEGKQMAMVILLPSSRTGLPKLEKDMQTQDLSSIINSVSKTQIELFMPKFKIETTIDLEEPLTKMGMGELFQNNADFSKISPGERLKISKAVQKTIIQVAENGTEAVSATFIGGVGLSGTFNPPPQVVIDHPFLFYLLHYTSASNYAVLFSGRVVRPEGFENQQFPY